MKYPFPDRKPYDWHKEYPAPNEFDDVVRILQAARDLLERGRILFICIACMQAARDLRISVRVALMLTGVIEERLRPNHDYDTWLINQAQAKWPLHLPSVLQGRLAWVDDLIKEFS